MSPNSQDPRDVIYNLSRLAEQDAKIFLAVAYVTKTEHIKKPKFDKPANARASKLISRNLIKPAGVQNIFP